MSDTLPTHRALRLVLDTNVVLDLVYWRDPAVRSIETALENGAALAVGDAECLAELREVLGRPIFAREDFDPAAVFADYQASCQNIAAAATNVRQTLPRCRDASDQKFLELARDAGADLLVTRDKALLTLARRKFGITDFRIVTPQQAATLLASA